MKIVHVTDYFQPQAGYQEFFLARAHRDMGHEVVVLTSDRYFPFPDYARTWQPVLGARLRGPGDAEEHGVRVRRLPVWAERPANAFVLLRGLARALAELAPDLVMGHDLLSPTTYVLARTQPGVGYRLVVDNHACDFNTTLDDSLLKRIYMRLFRTFSAPLIRSRARAIAAIGAGEQEMACRVLELPPADVPVVPLGADTVRFAPDEPRRRAARERLGLADAAVIVHAGKLTPEKDVLVLARAFARLAPRHPRARLLLVGGGDPAYLAEVRAALPAGSFTVHPTVPNEQLADLLRAADVGVWPGNFSQVIVEALACGLPVVLPDLFCPGYPSSALVSEDNGLAFPRGDVDRLAAALDALLADPAAARRRGEASRRLALEKLAWPALAHRVIELAGA